MKLIQKNEIQTNVDVLSLRTLVLVISDIFDFKETRHHHKNRYMENEINGLYQE